MTADQSPALTDEDRPASGMPMEIGPWGLAGDMPVPARHMIWASFALLAAALAVALFA
jgi:hypothetical protein